MVNVPIISDEQLTAVVNVLGREGIALAGISTHLPSLDEVFLAITGQKTSEAGHPRTTRNSSTWRYRHERRDDYGATTGEGRRR